MRNTSFSKMAALPVGLLTLALTMPFLLIQRV